MACITYSLSLGYTTVTAATQSCSLSPVNDPKALSAESQLLPFGCKAAVLEWAVLETVGGRFDRTSLLSRDSAQELVSGRPLGDASTTLQPQRIYGW